MAGLAYRHILSVVRREAAARGLDHPSLLDAGCGDGSLLELIGEALAGSRSGFDSPDYGLQTRDRVGRLAGDSVDIRITDSDGSWPFDDSSFDIVVSNQVCEHVVDLGAFCAENARVLRTGGFAVHAFPLKHIFIEPHMHLPLVHRIRDHELRQWLIARLSQLGIGIYRTQAREAGVPLETFARTHADYARTFTTYRTWHQVCDEFHRHGFRVSYGHTSTLIQRAIWRLVGNERDGQVLPPPLEAALFPLIRTVASCTLVVQKSQDYSFTWLTSAAGSPKNSSVNAEVDSVNAGVNTVTPNEG